MQTFIENEVKKDLLLQEVFREIDGEKLLTVKQFCSMYKWPSESALRAYIYRAEELGLSEAFIRVQRRVLVEPKIFFKKIRGVQQQAKKGDFYESIQNEGKACV